jgi:hypothetical protein
MSYWKAYATARDVPDADLRDRLIATLETLHGIGKALDCDPTESAIVERWEDATGQIVDLENEAVDNSSDRLEEALQEKAELEERVTKLEALRAEDALRLKACEPLLAAFSDSLAMARRFVSLAEQSKIKPEHVRPIGRARKANDNG